MLEKTKNIGLSVTTPDDGQTYVKEWRHSMDSNEDGSNMVIIDKKLGDAIYTSDETATTENMLTIIATTLRNNTGSELSARTKTNLVTNVEGKNIDTLLRVLEDKLVADVQAKTDEAIAASDPKGSASAVKAELLPQISSKAPLASPSFTGTPTAPTAELGSANIVQVANLEFVNNAVAAFVNGAPGALDTLNELAAALGNDPNFATTITNMLAEKAKRAMPATSGNLAKLDGNGNLVDSGKSTASFETAGSLAAHNSASDAHAGVLTKKYFFTVNLPVSGWSASAPFVQTISVAGMRAEYDPMYDVVYTSYTDDYKRQREEMQYISLLTTANGSITARCDSDKPTGNISIKMKEVF